MIHSYHGAVRFLSNFVEEYLDRFFLERFERRHVKTIGFGVINIETSVASNYFNRFYNRQFDYVLMAADYPALANVGIIVSRFFFRDKLFI